MTISVIIPTYCRPQNLQHCLTALERQTRLADEVLVVVRDSDEETQDFLTNCRAGILCLRIVPVRVPGVVAAMNAALMQATSEIIALTDDDAAPHPDWLLRIENHFLNDDRIGGVGGRDWVHQGGSVDRASAKVVGKVQWFGRLIGNHRNGIGQPRRVDVLKGVNCAYRVNPLRQIGFDQRLKGSGAQVHWELSLGFAFKHAGFRLIYDPKIGVDHFESQRFDEDQRVSVLFNAEAQYNAVYNETLIILQYLPAARRIAYLIWAFMIGTHVEPGLIQLLRLLARRDRHAVSRWSATIAGRLAGMKSRKQESRSH